MLSKVNALSIGCSMFPSKVPLESLSSDCLRHLLMLDYRRIALPHLQVGTMEQPVLVGIAISPLHYPFLGKVKVVQSVVVNFLDAKNWKTTSAPKLLSI